MPEDAQGMRKMWNGHPGQKYYPQLHTEVDLPYEKVVQHVKRMAHQCLEVTRNVSEKTDDGATAHWQDVYTPTMAITRRKSELFLVETMPGNAGSEQHIPLITADFTPAAGNRTKVVIYHLAFDPSLRTAHAIAAWAEAKDVGCPDMNR